MVDGDIMWWPACITSITNPVEVKNELAVTEFRSEAVIDNKNHFTMSNMDPSNYYIKHPHPHQSTVIHLIRTL